MASIKYDINKVVDYNSKQSPPNHAQDRLSMPPPPNPKQGTSHPIQQQSPAPSIRAPTPTGNLTNKFVTTNPARGWSPSPNIAVAASPTPNHPVAARGRRGGGGGNQGTEKISKDSSTPQQKQSVIRPPTAVNTDHEDGRTRATSKQHSNRHHRMIPSNQSPTAGQSGFFSNVQGQIPASSHQQQQHQHSGGQLELARPQSRSSSGQGFQFTTTAPGPVLIAPSPTKNSGLPSGFVQSSADDLDASHYFHPTEPRQQQTEEGEEQDGVHGDQERHHNHNHLVSGPLSQVLQFFDGQDGQGDYEGDDHGNCDADEDERNGNGNVEGDNDTLFGLAGELSSDSNPWQQFPPQSQHPESLDYGFETMQDVSAGRKRRHLGGSSVGEQGMQVEERQGEGLEGAGEPRAKKARQDEPGIATERRRRIPTSSPVERGLKLGGTSHRHRSNPQVQDKTTARSSIAQEQEDHHFPAPRNQQQNITNTNNVFKFAMSDQAQSQAITNKTTSTTAAGSSAPATGSFEQVFLNSKWARMTPEEWAESGNEFLARFGEVIEKFQKIIKRKVERNSDFKLSTNKRQKELNKRQQSIDDTEKNLQNWANEVLAPSSAVGPIGMKK